MRMFSFITGDASEEAVLAQARIENAAGLVAVLPSDADNVFVTLTARQMHPELKIIAKGTDEQSISKLRRAGADRVITPAKIAGRRIASSILRPSVVNFLDVIVEDTEVSMRMEEFAVDEDSPPGGKNPAGGGNRTAHRCHRPGHNRPQRTQPATMRHGRGSPR